jgi:hypothetical protein
MMKLRSGKYDPATKVLRLFGTETRDPPFDLQLDDPNQFLAWLGSVLFSEARKPGVSEPGFHAITADYSIGGNAADGFSLGFSFQVGQARMTYFVPIKSRSAQGVRDAASRFGKALADLVGPPPMPPAGDRH